MSTFIVWYDFFWNQSYCRIWLILWNKSHCTLNYSWRIMQINTILHVILKIWPSSTSFLNIFLFTKKRGGNHFLIYKKEKKPEKSRWLGSHILFTSAAINRIWSVICYKLNVCLSTKSKIILLKELIKHLKNKNIDL